MRNVNLNVKILCVDLAVVVVYVMAFFAERAWGLGAALQIYFAFLTGLAAGIVGFMHSQARLLQDKTSEVE